MWFVEILQSIWSGFSAENFDWQRLMLLCPHVICIRKQNTECDLYQRHISIQRKSLWGTIHYKLLANLSYIEAVELTSKTYSFHCFLFDKNQSIASIIEIKFNQSTPHYFRSCFQLSNCSAGISFQIWLKRSLNLDVYLQAGIGLCFFTKQYVPWRNSKSSIWLSLSPPNHLYGLVSW